MLGGYVLKGMGWFLFLCAALAIIGTITSEPEQLIAGLVSVLFMLIVPGFLFYLGGKQRLKRIKKWKALEKEAALLQKQSHEAKIARMNEEARKRAANQSVSASAAPISAADAAKMIECAGCGARQSVLPNQSTECEYCSSAIVYS